MSLRALSVLPLLVLAACSSPRDTTPTEPLSDPIFRYVNLGPLGEFELGEPFGDSARLAVAEGENTYRLRGRTFGGAESIVVTTDDGGIVRQISFEYGPGYGWDDYLNSFTESIGVPSRVNATEVVWNDGQTEFTLSRTSGAPHAARALMRDLSTSP